MFSFQNIIGFFSSAIMGNSFTQFINALRQGWPTKALELYRGDKKLRSAVKGKLNESLGPEHYENTVLHYTAMLKMKELYCELISDGGKPDMKNKDRRNCLHLMCLVGATSNTQVVCDMMRHTLEYGLTGMDMEHVLEERDVVSLFDDDRYRLVAWINCEPSMSKIFCDQYNS